ncbi:type VI secretion system tip protein TssI/VgrG [Afifella marina]|nr:type VI secretion system tip protein TssI/VgrG [Afifella marina]RAI22518.1 type VI secretion protein VgrG [Afifella marina DSM 2698]
MDDLTDTIETGSASDFIQAGRVLKVVSPLGEDVLLPERATIVEGVNELFSIELVVRAKREAVEPGELIGRRIDVLVEIQQGAGEEGGGFGGGGGEDSKIRRPFNALVTDLDEGPMVTRGVRSYTLTLRPEMWLLSRRSDCRIFLDKTAMEVCELLFAEHGLTAPDFSGVILNPPAQHYSVQWNETDLAYVLRRFEEDGLFYWFEHEEGRHKLMVGDHQSAWSKPSAAAEGEAAMRIAQGSSDRNRIDAWRRRYSYVSGKRSGADWNFETPNTVPSAETPSLVELPENAKRELYEYPARAMDVAAHERMEKLRMQASEADHDRVNAGSNIRVVEPGRRFAPYEVAHPEKRYEEHVVIRAVHQVVDRSYETAEDEPEYRNAFEAMPSRIPLTPHRTTKRPRIEGAQVGIVAGPEGEEIHCDQYGRVKLWFPWDRRAKKDGSDTCWVRVSQSWAGGTWGGQIIPRIGMEAMVSYIDGDPDRPLITGLVPNPQQAVPYELPANKTKSVFRTNTHKSEYKGFNEINFEDEVGREELYMHAQKDMNIHVMNNEGKRVENNSSVLYGNNNSVEVSNNSYLSIGGGYTISVGRSGLRSLASYGVGGLAWPLKAMSYSLCGDLIDHIGDGNFSMNIEGSEITLVGRSSMENIAGNKNINTGGAFRRKYKFINRNDIISGHVLFCRTYGDGTFWIML